MSNFSNASLKTKRIKKEKLEKKRSRSLYSNEEVFNLLHIWSSDTIQQKFKESEDHSLIYKEISSKHNEDKRFNRTRVQVQMKIKKMIKQYYLLHKQPDTWKSKQKFFKIIDKVCNNDVNVVRDFIFVECPRDISSFSDEIQGEKGNPKNPSDEEMTDLFADLEGENNSHQSMPTNSLNEIVARFIKISEESGTILQKILRRSEDERMISTLLAEEYVNSVILASEFMKTSMVKMNYPIPQVLRKPSSIDIVDKLRKYIDNSKSLMVSPIECDDYVRDHNEESLSITPYYDNIIKGEYYLS